MAATGTGALEIADGIQNVPVYGYQPPAAFFAAGPPVGAGIFDIRDFGAVSDPAVNSQPAIQAAIDAAHAAGGGIVYVPPGTWGIAAHPDGYGSVHLLSNVFLKGAGMGVSELRLVDGSSGDVTGLVRSQWGVETTNWGLADLTIDGNKEGTSGRVDGFFTGPSPGSALTDKDIHVLRVEIENVSRYGFDPHERTERLSIKDSVAHHNGVDGFVIDYNIDAELTGNVSFANGRHGFNFVTTAQDILVKDNVAHGNGGAGFVVQRGSENIEAPHGITIVGGAAFDNGREGVLVQLSSHVSVTGMEIYDNGFSGVRILGSSHVTVSGNVVRDNSQALHDGYSEVAIASFDDRVYGLLHRAEHNLIEDNTIAATGTVRSRYGIEERAGGTGHNIVGDNDIEGTVRGPLALSGTGSYLLKLGTEGADTIVGSATQDFVDGGSGADTLSGGDGRDLIDGGRDNDSLSGGKGDDELWGGDGDDTLNGNSGGDQLFGGAGRDLLVGDAGNDRLHGGGGNDTVRGGSGDDVVVADSGNDQLDGGSGFDTLDFAGLANAVIVDLAARTSTGAGTDTLASFEAVVGTAFADRITGDKAANTLLGGAGADVLRGMGGADRLTGGEGRDVLLWGAAKDVVDSGVHLGVDVVTDFTVGEDALALGALLANQAWSRLDDVVRVTDTAEGTLVAVRIGGAFQSVVLLEGVHGLTGQAMADAGMLLL